MRHTLQWTRITDPDAAVTLMPAWFGSRMIKARGSFGLLLTTGDVLRCTSIAAVYLSSTGVILLDVMLDNAGVPEGVDLAWRSKHYLGVPAPSATLSTVNLAHVVAVVEFVAAEFARQPGDIAIPETGEALTEAAASGPEADAIAREPVEAASSGS